MLRKLYDSVSAQFAKIVNSLWNRDPIAVMRYLRGCMQRELGNDYENVASVKAVITGCDRHIDECAKRVDDDIRMVEAGKRVGDLEQAGLYAQRYEEDINRLEAAKRRKEAMCEKYGILLDTLGEKRRQLDECEHSIKCHEAELHAARLFKSSSEIAVEVGEGAYSRFDEASRNVQEQVDRMQAYCDMAGEVRRGGGRVAAEANRIRHQEALERFEKLLSKESTPA